MTNATKAREKKERLARGHSAGMQGNDHGFDYNEMDGDMDLMGDDGGAGDDIDAKLQLEH